MKFRLLLFAVAGWLASPAVGEAGRLPVLPNDEAWKRLPGAPAAPQPLPPWARMLAGPMPRTTSAMLELDAMHRTGDRLDARTRWLVRSAAADANGCTYSKAFADADYPAPRDAAERSKGERAAVTFARKMMLKAYSVTDEDFRAVLDAYGEERTVAIVALLAHASFQDRIILALGESTEPAGPLPPITVKFVRPKPPHAPPGAPLGNTGKVERSKGLAGDPEWLGATFGELQSELARQKSRDGRIRVPSVEEVRKKTGPDHQAGWQSGILWSRVCYGFQPELTDAWFETTGQFGTESRLDGVFKQSIFWVVTRSLQCFY